MWDTQRYGPKPFPRTAGLLTGFATLQPPPLRTFTRHSNEFYEISDWFNVAANAAPGQRPPPPQQSGGPSTASEMTQPRYAVLEIVSEHLPG